MLRLHQRTSCAPPNHGSNDLTLPNKPLAAEPAGLSASDSNAAVHSPARQVSRGMPRQSAKHLCGQVSPPQQTGPMRFPQSQASGNASQPAPLGASGSAGTTGFGFAAANFVFALVVLGLSDEGSASTADGCGDAAPFWGAACFFAGLEAVFVQGDGAGGTGTFLSLIASSCAGGCAEALRSSLRCACCRSGASGDHQEGSSS